MATTNLPFGLQGMAPKPAEISGASQQQFAFPDLAKILSGIGGGTAEAAANAYMPFIQNPTAHPMFQNALGGLLNSLVPSEQMARTNLMDQFRSAGNMSSSAFGGAAMGLEGELMRGRNQMASQLLTTIFPQITQALWAPQSQISPLLTALKMQNQVQYAKPDNNSGALAGAGGQPSVSYRPGAPSQAPTVTTNYRASMPAFGAY